MIRRRSLGWPITLGVIMIVLLVALTVGWIVLGVAASQRSAYWYLVLGIGAAFLILVLVGVVLYLALSIKEIRLNQRQSNFIDSVTHELKSPIASLKLYLQTLSRRNVTEAEQSSFYRFMLDDLERLDTLINHMLDAARLDHRLVADETIDVDMAAMLENCARTACQQHRLDERAVTLRVAPAIVRARPIDLEMIFRNLIDNAIKYGGDAPEITVESMLVGQRRVVTHVIDNGPGIPIALRRKIFGRFVRLGMELERSKIGTGLGLYIVRTLVKRMRGTIQVRGRGTKPGTIFAVELPGRAMFEHEHAA